MENTYFIDPQNETELARLIRQDKAYGTVLDLLPGSFVPTPNMRLLDLACGPGNWLLQVAQAYPATSLVGIDIDPLMIQYARAQAKAQNAAIQFSLKDLLQIPWDFPDHYVDLINARFIASLTPAAKFPAIWQECWRLLRPGGVIRNIENVFTSTPTNPTGHKLFSLMSQATYKAGLGYSPYEMGTSVVTAQTWKRLGFQQVTITPSVMDFSAGTAMYPIMKEVWLVSISMIKPFLVKMGVATSQQVDNLLADYIREWESEDLCGHYYLCSLSAMKPT